MTKELEIVRPDDWHLHLRDGTILKSVLPYTSKIFGRSIIMPNLIPPITTVQDATMYKNRIIEALPNDHSFRPLMTLYLTETTDVMDLAEGFAKNLISAVKLYPAGATTNSSLGVNDFTRLYKVFEKMEAPFSKVRVFIVFLGASTCCSRCFYICLCFSTVFD